jgi:hypothetical protein
MLSANWNSTQQLYGATARPMLESSVPDKFGDATPIRLDFGLSMKTLLFVFLPICVLISPDRRFFLHD